jgi:hypothetical protein
MEAAWVAARQPLLVSSPGAPAAELREQIALIVTDYSTGGEDISRTIDLLLALSAPSQGADPDHAIGDEVEESADLHMQWASDGDDLEASFNKLHAYAKRLEERLAAHPGSASTGPTPRAVRMIAEVSGRHNTKPGYRHLMIRAPRRGGEIWEGVLSGWVHGVHADEIAERINSFEAPVREEGT